MSLAAFYAAHSKLIDQIGINALLALSLSVSLRAGQLALAQAAFMGIAAYVGAIGAVRTAGRSRSRCSRGRGPPRVAAFLLALPIGRLRGVFLAIATIAFGEIARVVEINLQITGGAEGYSGIPNDANTLAIYGTLAAAGDRRRGVRLGIRRSSRSRSRRRAKTRTPRAASGSTRRRSGCSRSSSAP